VFWHDYVADYGEAVADSHLLDYFEEEVATFGSIKELLSAITTACDEVESACAVVTL
jgi:hypothetical protein